MTLILDIETQYLAESVGGWDFTGKMGVSCAVTFEPKRDEWRVYSPSQVNELRDVLSHAERIVTYNGWSFDLPVVYGLDRPEWESSGPANHLRAVSWDLLQAIRSQAEPYQKGWRLGEVSLRTIGEGKSGDGVLAPELYAENRWGELVSYCWRDVWLTAKLYEFVQRFGYVVCPGNRKLQLGGVL